LLTKHIVSSAVTVVFSLLINQQTRQLDTHWTRSCTSVLYNSYLQSQRRVILAGRLLTARVWRIRQLERNSQTDTLASVVAPQIDFHSSRARPVVQHLVRRAMANVVTTFLVPVTNFAQDGNRCCGFSQLGYHSVKVCGRCSKALTVIVSLSTWVYLIRSGSEMHARLGRIGKRSYCKADGSQPHDGANTGGTRP
jgi:hypothetical protein